MMENRSFDHYLGALSLNGRPDVNGLTHPLPSNSDDAGLPTSSWCIDDISLDFPSPPHEWQNAHLAWANGANSGFITQYETVTDQYLQTPMGYYSNNTLSALYALADEFVVCDQWFASVLSSTWPNRKYLHSGQRDARKDTGNFPPLPHGFATSPIYTTLESASDPANPSSKLSWKCYYSDGPFLGFWIDFAIKHRSNFTDIRQFVSDCRFERLPTVSIVDPPFTFADDHPTHHPRLGQRFIKLIADALTNSPSWHDSVLLILYDEYGGFYDHVAPPTSPEGASSVDSPLGFRVPALVVSPYSGRRVSHEVFDHTSVIKSISERWQVNFGQSYGQRWNLAKSIWKSCFDFTKQPIPKGTYTGGPVNDVAWTEKGQGQPDDLEQGLVRLVETITFQNFDLRSHAYTMLSLAENDVQDRGGSA